MVDSDDGSDRRYGPPSDRAIAAHAGARHGVVSLAELGDLGLGPRGAQLRCGTGRLHRLYAGVYAVGHPGVGVDGRRRAAVLACGRGAALSHSSAGAAWGICADDASGWHVTTPRTGRAGVGDIRVHTSRTLSPDLIEQLRAVPVTTVARTLIDLAGVLDREALERAVHEAQVRRLLNLPMVMAALEAHPGRRGTGRLRGLVGLAAGPTRSMLEQRFAGLCRRGGIEGGAVNRRVGAYEVDVLWDDARVIVELDGAAFHDTRRAFERDRRRDADLMAAGYVVLRFTWRRIAEEPWAVLRELRAVLAARGGQF